MRGARSSLVLVTLALSACGAPLQPTPSSVATPGATPAAPTPAATPAAPTPSISAPPPTASAANATPTPTDDARTAGWRSDLELLVPGMDLFHPELDHGISNADLDLAVAELAATVPTADDDELMVDVLRIVASVSADGCDGHLGAFVWGTGTYPTASLPLRLWLFEDGVYVVDALPPYEDLIGQEVLSMGGHPIDEVLTTFDPIVPRDNEQTVRLLLPRFLLIPQMHAGLGLIEDPGQPMDMELGVRSAIYAETVEPIPMAEYNAWAGPYGLHLPEDPDVLYLSDIADDLWWKKLDDGTLYVQYNRVDYALFGGLAEALADDSLTRVVLDVRHNFGGEVPVLDQIVPLFTDPAVDQPDRLYLITGRNTFSAASLLTARLQQETSAVIVGESMGGCPTFWADIEPLRLPYSGIEIGVPTVLMAGVDARDERSTIEPDLPAPLTPQDWARGIDPALDAIGVRSE